MQRIILNNPYSFRIGDFFKGNKENEMIVTGIVLYEIYKHTFTKI